MQAIWAKGLLDEKNVAVTFQYAVTPAEDTVLELALDSGMLTGGKETAPFCEVEVELKSGSQEAADLFASVLADEYGLTLENKSKFRRALALYQKGGSV